VPLTFEIFEASSGLYTCSPSSSSFAFLIGSPSSCLISAIRIVGFLLFGLETDSGFEISGFGISGLGISYELGF